VVGIRTEGQLDEIIGTMDSPMLDSETYDLLSNVLERNHYMQHLE
jgi:hypothetical protein